MSHELLVLGLSHRTAPIDMREKLAVPPERLPDWLLRLRSLPGIEETTVLSTCNRVEIYAASPDRVAAFTSIYGDLVRQIGADGNPNELEMHLYRRHGRAAVQHLFRVAASLDSLVVGEPQILGQIKEAFDVASRAGSIGSILGVCFPRAFRVARRIRRETGIARNPVSVSSVAVDMARRVFAGFTGRRVLLVGAGKMGDLAARALSSHGATLTVTNRTLARAQELAASLGGVATPFEKLSDAMVAVDVIITSTGASKPLIDRNLMVSTQKRRRGRALVVVDIAVPRDVAPDAGDVEGVFLWDIDDLQKEAAVHLSGRREEAEHAETLVEEEVVRFVQNMRGQAVGPTIKALRERFAAVARNHAEKLHGRVAGMDEGTRAEVDRMMQALVNELLHMPQVALKKSAADDEDVLLAGAVERLFGLKIDDGDGERNETDEPERGDTDVEE